ncbi:proteasome component ECM29 like protein [Zymoseptoria brevis]|uniref:Proteasome component ECM29 like protein n=1 Tax=Zymoseptoria brevis TaxID=1047168 RepID=A0A0F4GJQ5_9PEZI|nr:proteasome component ECM29 like protein [Zymoseptoria brevis]
MSAPAQTPEQRELALIGKVEMRIALADTDTKLESLLNTYLAPVLLKLASEHNSVRQKVIAICQHVNTRIQPQSIQLPVAALVKQFKEQKNTMIRHFDLLYIQQGVVRLSKAYKAELLPVVVSGIAQSGTQMGQIFYLFLRLLESFPLPPRGSKEDLEMRTKMDLSEEDATFLSTQLGNFMLFALQKGASKVCPGLTPDEYSFFGMDGKEGAWNPAAGGLNLLQTKILAAKLLASGLFNDSERFLAALFASADPSSSISDVGDDMLKRAMPVTDLEDETLIHRLFQLYFGGSSGTNDAPRVKAPLRLKILGLLNKSTRSTTFANNITKLVADGVSTSGQDGEDVLMSNGPQQSTSIGREASKLRAAIFSYINFVARFGDKQSLHAIAPQVVVRLRDFIENQGWPKPGLNEDLISRAYAYEVIGLLSKAGPRSVLVEEEHASLDLLRWLFDSLAQDASGNSITVSIEESLSTVLGAMSRFEFAKSEQDVLENLLIDQMAQSADLEGSKRLRSTRYVAVRFANRCLPYSSVKARWVDVLAMGATSDRPEVREEGERGLSPYWYRMLNGSNIGAKTPNVSFPSFEAVVEQFFIIQTQITSSKVEVLVQKARELNKSSFQFMTSFARRMLVTKALEQAKVPVNLDSEWERRLDAMIESDAPARDAVKAHLSSTMSSSPELLDILVGALFACVTSESAVSEDNLVEFLALSPEALIKHHVDRAMSMLPTLKSNNHRKRMTAAQVIGILGSHPGCNAAPVISVLTDVLQDWQKAVGAHLSHVHGVIVALGFYFSRVACRTQSVPQNSNYSAVLDILFKMFAESRDSTLHEASHIAIGQMCMFSCLTPESIGQYSTLEKVSDKLYERAKEGNESAITCLGQLSMVVPEGDDKLKHIEDHLHKLHEIRQSEIHFTVGEAFSYLAAGWQSTALSTKLDIGVPADISMGHPRTQTLSKLVDRVLKDCATTKPALKKAAVMWLLCLVQYCGETIQGRLAECQNAFRRCLSDRDELVQESSSRGLGLVYEKGDRSLKDDLVRDLVSSFSSDKAQLSGNVSADTQLFEPGALPTGDGSVSTYKDIMSLASEVGDSSLVYKFMSMASSNAIWSSRAAFGRFGLSRVLSDSSVDGYLANNPKLYPKLFRYRFDPNGGVQRSMNDIWTALVPDSTATIDKHFDAIMEDLLSSILGKEWRVRQACCAAIADLVQGRSIEKYEGYLEQIWTQCFRVLDDIKESVRAAAASLARTLTGVLTRALEADHSSTKNASAMLKHVLPFLLSPSGMESSAKEVQIFSVRTLLEIIKKANGATIRPFIPELVERLIGLLSSLEPEEVNYIHLNASKYNLTEQKLDDMRLSAVRSSPLTEAIERCLDLLDDDTMKLLWPTLESAMKNAVGLPSKVGSSRVLVSLATRRMVLFKPYADDALRLLEKLVIDRNDTVASSYAAAAGYVARGASDKQILRLIGFAKKLYFDSEGDRESITPRRSITSGEIMLAFAKQASDKFNEFSTSALPFVFVAKHDSHEQVKERFQDTWDESVGGSRAVQLYLNEILELCASHLDSAQWTLKHTAARAVADATIAVSASEAEMSDATGKALWPALEKALGGKTWEGKEVVLTSFVKFVEAGKKFYLADEKVKSAIVKIALREAKRQNSAYRQYSVKALAGVALARSDVDLSDDVHDVVGPILAEAGGVDEDAMDIDGKDGSSTRKADDIKQATTAAAIDALLASVPVPPTASPDVSSKSFVRALHTVNIAPQTAISHPASLRSLYDGLAGLFRRIVGEKPNGSLTATKNDATSTAPTTTSPFPLRIANSAASEFHSLLFGPVSAGAIETVRSSRGQALVAISRSGLFASSTGGRDHTNHMSRNSFRASVRGLLVGEISVVVKEKLKDVVARLD